MKACIKHIGDTHAQQTYYFTDPPPPAWQGADGSGQTVGLLEFDTFHLSDIAAYISLVGLPSTKLADVSQVHVDGGAGSSPGAGVDEVLLDIDAILAIAPGAKVAVYDGAFSGANTSFQAMFSAMVDGGVDIISNSWAYCEDQTSLADVQSYRFDPANRSRGPASAFSAAAATAAAVASMARRTRSRFRPIRRTPPRWAERP